MAQKQIMRSSISANRKHLLSDTTTFAVAEAYKTARTNLKFVLAGAERKAIVFSSCSPVEGKSLTCVNMALAFAQTGAKVLIIDADLRKPTVQSLLRVKGTDGLSTVLGRFSGLEESIVKGIAPNLDVLVAGTIPPNPAELLGAGRLDEILKACELQYDHILIDSPPILMVSDALILSPYVAGFVFVVREAHTTHPALTSAFDAIRRTEGKVLGIIKVGCNLREGTNDSKYDYGYGAD